MKSKVLRDSYTLGDLRAWADVTRGLKPSIGLGVIGDPIAHSLSPQMQNAALRQSAIELQYARFEIRPNELKESLDLFRTHGFAGLNVTLPHKEAVAGLMDELDPDAKQVGAVNCVAF